MFNFFKKFYSIENQKKHKTEKDFDKIIKICCDFYEVSSEDVLGKSRKKNIVEARQVIVYLTYKFSNNSSTVIGKKLGGRDHSTILYAYDKIKKGIKTNKKLQKEISKIEKLIKANSNLNFRLNNRKTEALSKEIRGNKKPERTKDKRDCINVDGSKVPIVLKSVKDLPFSHLDPKSLKRQKDILEKYKKGWTLASIGRRHGVSRQRVQMIVDKALTVSLEKPLRQGLEINLRNFLKKEREKHNLKWKKRYKNIQEAPNFKNNYYYYLNHKEDREKNELIYWFYLNLKNKAEVGRLVGLTRERIRQIVKRIEKTNKKQCPKCESLNIELVSIAGEPKSGYNIKNYQTSEKVVYHYACNDCKENFRFYAKK